MSDVERMVAELEQASERLMKLADAGQADEAAELVQRCARLTSELAAALGQEAREARADPAGGPGQETLI